MLATFACLDPRDPDGEAELPVVFQISNFGEEPSGYGEHYDPGCGPEFELMCALDVCGEDVLATLSADQTEALEDDIRAEFDFHAAKREARYEDA